LRFAVLPRRSTPILARIPFCGTPPAQNAPACARAPVDSEPVDGSIPPADVTVETTGGAHPIGLSLGVQPPAYADRFEILVPPGGATVVPSGPRADFEEAQRRGQPAANLRRIIRFKGLPAGTPVPTSIIVMVQATDHRGENTGVDFRLYPYSPRMTSAAAMPRTPVTLQTVSMSLQFSGLGLATKMIPRASVFPGCRWWELGDGIGPGSVPAGQTNILRNAEIDLPAPTLSRRGAFTGQGPCDFRFDMSLAFPFMVSGQLTPFVSLRSPQPITFAPRQEYRVTNTWQLKEKWNWFPTGDDGVTTKMGQCTGISDFGAGKFPVGRQEHNNDLSFRIRSGPAGTDCIYHHLYAVDLPDGFRLERSLWTPSSTAQCRVIDEDDSSDDYGVNAYSFDEQPWTFAPGLADFRGFSGPLISGRTTLIATNNPDNRLRVILRPVLVHLKCNNTAINDHQVRMTLDEVTFSGPPGVSFP
jgi:hypothetical protein